MKRSIISQLSTNRIIKIIFIIITVGNIISVSSKDSSNYNPLSRLVPSTDVLRYLFGPTENKITEDLPKNNSLIKRKFRRLSPAKRRFLQNKRRANNKRRRNRKNAVSKPQQTGFGNIFSRLTSIFFKSIKLDNAIQHLGMLKNALLNYGKIQTAKNRRNSVATSRDGIAFPSLEGALLSLAFLTFAVFLIDLVQNLLSRLKVQTPAAKPSGTNMMMAAASVSGRRKRDIFSSLQNLSTLTSIVFRALENPLFS